MKKKVNKYKNSEVEYGEFIMTYFKNVSLDEQKENVKKLENITKKKHNKEKGGKNDI